MKTQHTPGPWEIARCKRGNLGDKLSEMQPYIAIQSIAVNGNGPDATICYVEGQDGFKFGGAGIIQQKVNNEANARLIAAAPELLEALEELVTDGECYCADYVANKKPCGFCQARAAIAKAKGGTSE